MKCIYKPDCEAIGEPEPPNEVYICPACTAEIVERARRAWAEYRRKLQRHQDN